MPPVITYTRYLEISGIPLATPAWKVIDLAPLLDGPDLRGADRLVPGAVGVRPYPRRATVSIRTLQMVIFGDRSLEGTPYANRRDGIDTNVAYLVDNLLAPPGGNGTRLAILHLQNGSMKSAYVHVLSPLRLGHIGPGAVRGALDLSIPSGKFVPGSSG